jgi:hypothetical protein
MTDQIIPPASGAAELLPVLERIAAALDRLALAQFAANCIAEDSNRYICSTLAEGLYELRDKPTKGRGRA